MNGFEFVVNAELIEWIEAIPDTTITLATGTKVIVKQSMDEVMEKILVYRREIYHAGTRPAEALLKTFVKEKK